MEADLPCVSGTLNRSARSYREWDEKLSWIELNLKTVIEPTVRFPSLKEERSHLYLCNASLRSGCRAEADEFANQEF
jgi:hypothetical protein